MSVSEVLLPTGRLSWEEVTMAISNSPRQSDSTVTLGSLQKLSMPPLPVKSCTPRLANMNMKRRRRTKAKAKFLKPRASSYSTWRMLESRLMRRSGRRARQKCNNLEGNTCAHTQAGGLMWGTTRPTITELFPALRGEPELTQARLPHSRPLGLFPALCGELELT